MKRALHFLFFLAVVAAVPSNAQTFTISETSTITIDGKSNKSDWSVEAHVFTGSVTLEEGAPVASEVSFETKGMKSGRSLIMDRLMYGSLKADEHPAISFVQTSAEAGEEGVWNVSGGLSLAGQTQSVIVALTRSDADEAVLFSGAYTLNMRDYGIKPPTAMFGALLTKPDVVLTFNLVLAN